MYIVCILCVEYINIKWKGGRIKRSKTPLIIFQYNLQNYVKFFDSTWFPLCKIDNVVFLPYLVK